MNLSFDLTKMILNRSKHGSKVRYMSLDPTRFTFPKHGQIYTIDSIQSIDGIRYQVTFIGNNRSVQFNAGFIHQLLDLNDKICYKPKNIPERKSI